MASSYVVVCVVQMSGGCATAADKSLVDSALPLSVTSAMTSAEMSEVCTRHLLSPGIYRLVPCTSQPNVEANFLLRVFTKSSSSLTYDVLAVL